MTHHLLFLLVGRRMTRQRVARCDAFRKRPFRRGAAAVLAMLFLVLFSTLTVAMFSVATTNVQTASNLSDVTRAQSAAEAGVRWMEYRFLKLNRPKRTEGVISSSVATALWPALRTAIINDPSSTAVYDLASMVDASERAVQTELTHPGDPLHAPWIRTSAIKMDDAGSTFRVVVQQHPLSATDTMDATWIRVSSTGDYKEAERTVTMDFKIDKKVKYAIAGKVPIQLGRNTIVEGPIAMATAGKYPPLLMLSDLTWFDSTLGNRITAWQTYLETKHAGYDGRISANNTTEYTAAVSAGYVDYNGDAFIDEYDIFLKRYDGTANGGNGDKAISPAEFTKPGTTALYDANLFAAIDAMGGPLFAGDVVRAGYKDGILDDRDGYSKVRGTVQMATSESGWKSNLPAGQTINDQMQGPMLAGDPITPPVQFSASTADLIDLSPANFEQCALNYKAKTGAAAGTTTKTAILIANTTLATTDANGGTVDEKTPYGSTTYQATYRRPIYKNMTLRNVRIPKGINALFDNCKFEGVTFIDTERDIKIGSTVSTNPNDGSTWAKVMTSGTFTTTTALTPSNSQGASKGNNVRFNNCTFEGPVTSPYATAYTHFANSWEFTGATLFDNKIDATATIVAPQTNIEMGSFTSPGQAPSTLVGVVVAGNIDIRGTSLVDGSIIVTGDGAGNTTLGYFGPSDADTNPSALPTGGYGRLNIRYNPKRALPDGINIAVDILPDINTYREGK